MEVIEMPGSIEDEKLAIAKRYLIKRQLASGIATVMRAARDRKDIEDAPQRTAGGAVPLTGWSGGPWPVHLPRKFALQN